MKIDRRCFLSLGVGAAAGVALSPLPWKLLDDSSIWSQNWPWTPVPKDGAASYVHSTCTLCPGGCGITVKKIGDRAVKIEGKAGHPVNNGGVCIMGLSGLQLLYGPTRVQSPLKRVGERGEGKWKEISWQEAIAEVAGTLQKIRAEGDAHTVAGIMESDRGTVPRLMQRLLTAYGSPNFFRMPSMQDSYEQALYLMQGVRAMPGFDVENADFILSFGSGLIEGWGAPVRMIQANSNWRSTGAHVVQVEPRLSNTAAKSDEWIPVKPGAEAALALGIAHVMIKENRCSGFADQAAFGFDDFVDDEGRTHKGFKQLVLESYSPETVAEVTGIDSRRIVDLARAFAAAKRPIALTGRGRGLTPGSVSDVMAIHALNALAGNINADGGIWAVPEPDYIEWPAPEMDRVAVDGIQKGRIDKAGGSEIPYTQYLLNRFALTAQGKGDYPIKALMVSEANPAYSLPDTRMFQKALDAIPFVVSFSSYMDETALQADLILPNHMYLERYEEVPAPAGYSKPLIGLTRPVIKPLYNTKHVGDTLIGIARQLGGNIAKAFPWTDYESCLRNTISGKWDSLMRKGFWWNAAYKPAPASNGFDTASGKFEFAVTIPRGTDKAGDALLPKYQPIIPEGDIAEFPLLLMPYETMCLSSGYTGSPPFMMKTVPDTVLKGNTGLVEISPETATSLNLDEGDPVMLTTPKGQANLRVHLSDGVPPGILAMPRGLGHRAYDDYMADKGVNINELMGPVEDPVSGLDAAWGIRANLTKA